MRSVSACSLPFRPVECPEFRALLLYLNDDIDTQLPDTHETVKKWIMRQFDAEKVKYFYSSPPPLPSITATIFGLAQKEAFVCTITTAMSRVPYYVVPLHILIGFLFAYDFPYSTDRGMASACLLAIWSAPSQWPWRPYRDSPFSHSMKP